jgi:hypothetical protein
MMPLQCCKNPSRERKYEQMLPFVIDYIIAIAKKYMWKNKDLRLQ